MFCVCTEKSLSPWKHSRCAWFTNVTSMVQYLGETWLLILTEEHLLKVRAVVWFGKYAGKWPTEQCKVMNSYEPSAPTEPHILDVGELWMFEVGVLRRASWSKGRFTLVILCGRHRWIVQCYFNGRTKFLYIFPQHSTGHKTPTLRCWPCTPFFCVTPWWWHPGAHVGVYTSCWMYFIKRIVW
jgi:hypothetical protein